MSRIGNFSAIQLDFDIAVSKYVTEFERITELELDYWEGGKIGEVACFGDFFLNFTDIKYIVDNENMFSDSVFFYWYNFNLTFPECYTNIDAYARLCRDWKNKCEKLVINFDKFEKDLLYMRIKSLKNV